MVRLLIPEKSCTQLNKKKHTFGKNFVFILMLSPVLIYFLLFHYLPMSGLVLAFKKYNHTGGIFGSPWVGFDNFRFLFVSGTILRVTFNTVLYNLIFLITCQFLAVVVAIVLNELTSGMFKKIFHSFMFLPYFVSFVVVGAIVYNFFNYEYGMVNTLLKSFGKEPLNVYGLPYIWWFILTGLNTWKWVGYTSIIYLAGVTNIDPQLYEAAKIDGANIWQRIRIITLPAIKPLIITIILFQLGSILKGQFELFYNVIGNNGQLYNATDVIDTYVFRMLVHNFDIGMGAAAGLYQSFFGLILILAANFLVRKYHKDFTFF
ncbi:MAG: sugar ABC transporter permease [Spirochaetales bacterium]|nr:sugar ABC transporter permease [Spirochaetales bacterium]